MKTQSTCGPNLGGGILFDLVAISPKPSASSAAPKAASRKARYWRSVCWSASCASATWRSNAARKSSRSWRSSWRRCESWALGQRCRKQREIICHICLILLYLVQTQRYVKKVYIHTIYMYCAVLRALPFVKGGLPPLWLWCGGMVINSRYASYPQNTRKKHKQRSRNKWKHKSNTKNGEKTQKQLKQV